MKSVSARQFPSRYRPNASELGFERFTGSTWNDTSGTSAHSHQEGWFISYIDILTLLLTLFVILLAMSHFNPDNASLQQDSVILNETENQNLKPLPLPSEGMQTSSQDVIPTDQNPEQLKADELLEKENHDQGLTSFSSEYSNVLMREIENSGLDHQIEISEEQNHVNLVISDHFLFAPGNADLKLGGLELLSQLAGMINATKLNMSIEGHTDNVPISSAHFPSNWELSTARATTVTRHLIANDISPDRIRAIGYADTRPRAENDTTKGREHNRRVSIMLHMPETDAQLDALTAIRQHNRVDQLNPV